MNCSATWPVYFPHNGHYYFVGQAVCTNKFFPPSPPPFVLGSSAQADFDSFRCLGVGRAQPER